MLEDVMFGDKYLDIGGLTEGSIMKKTCYLYDTNYSLSKLNEPFYSIYLKDINSNIIVGRIFSVERFIQSGVDMTLMKRQAVDVTFEVQMFRGNLSLIVSEIVLSKDTEFPYDKFIGKVENSKEACDNLNLIVSKVLGKNLTTYSRYEVFRSNTLSNGRSGAFAIALELVIANITSAGRLPAVNLVDICKTFHLVQHFYASYLQAIEDVDFVTEATKLNYLNKAYLQATKSEGYNPDVIMDTLSSILNLTPPEHLYAHIINDAFKQSFNMINLCYKYNTMPMYGIHREGDVILRRY